MSPFIIRNWLSGPTLWCVAAGLFGAANALAAGTASVSLRPTHVDLASATSRSAVLMTLSGYTAASAPRYRVYNGSNQYNPWDASSGTFIASTSYASNPTVPGDYVNGTAFWILYERGNNAAAGASYRDRLGTAYSANNNTIALPAATAMAAPFNLTGTLVAGGSYDLSVRYVILGFDSTSGGSLLCASFSDPTTGAFTLACNGGATLQRVEIRTITNTIITDATKTGSWTATTVLGNIDLSNSSTPPSFTSGINYSATSGVTMAFTVFATGSPTPELALESTTATVGSYSFAVATGVLDYTPPTNDVGTQTFTFTANNSAGVATQVVSVVVSDAPESAPVFSANPGPISATVEVTVAFTVSASGNPLPDLALDGTTATADSYRFTMGTGELSYTPPTNDVGAQSFLFSATNTQGTAMQTVTVAVASAPVYVPTITVTNIGTHAFTIHWTEVTNATTYQVQVATDTNFTPGTSGGGLFISEVADPSDNANARFVELFNASGAALDFSTATWHLSRQANGGTWGSVQLTGTLAMDATYVVAYNQAAYESVYSDTADLYNGSISGNGDDGYFLYAGGDYSSGTLVDAYGVIGQDGTGFDWEYLDTRAERNAAVTMPTSTWTAAEWTIPASAGVADMTPHNHTVTGGGGGAGGTLVRDATVAALTTDATGLDMETTYYVRVRATDGTWSTVTAATTTGGEPTAPSFTGGTGPYGASVGVMLNFTVSAMGTPAPTLALDAATADTNDYTFEPASGTFHYLPPLADGGTVQTFTFTASNSLGVATQEVSVTVAAAPITIPTVSVTDINTNSFTINWTACTDATNYQVQVATDTNFTAGASGNSATLASTANTGLSTDWAYVDGANNASSYHKLVSDTAPGVVSAEFSTLDFVAVTARYAVATFGGATANLLLISYSLDGETNWIPFATNSSATSSTYVTGQGNALPSAALGQSSVRIKWHCDVATADVGLRLQSLSVAGVQTDGSGSLVADAMVAALTYNATSLEMETTYHIRARQAGGEWSSVVSATTANPTPTAPFFGLNPGPIPTTAGVDVEFTISASGFPVPVLALANSTATTDSYLFEPETGYFIYLPPTNDVGAQVFHFSAINTEGSATQAVTVNVAAATAPAFGANPGPLGATTGVARVFTVTATGVPVPVLALQSVTATLGAYAFTAATGELSYTPPTADTNGIQTFTFTASNIAGVATQEVSVTVSKAPVLPTIDPLSALFIEVGQTSNLWVVAREADGDAITLSASNLPANASFTTVTGTGTISNWFTFSPSSNQVGQTYAVDFYASDTEGSTFQTLDITVASDDPWKDYYAMCYSNGVLKTGDDLKSALHDIIAGHTSFSYTAAENILKDIDECPTNSSMVQLLYLQYGRAKSNFGGGSGQWNREHVWAQSHGINGALPAYTDVHHLHPTDVTANSTRGNKDFDTVSGSADSYSYDSGAFEPPDAGKGDVARAMFYMAVRYNGKGDGSFTSDLELTDAIPTSGAKFGKLATLLDWNELDKVNDYEIRRNNLIYSDYQKNRNPFVDHPEWARIVFDPTYVTPHTLTASAGTGGSISPVSASVTNTGSQTFTIMADEGYRISTLLRNGVLVTPTNAYAGLSSYNYLWSNVTNNGTISATFVLAIPPLPAPAAVWANPTNAHSFTANWSSVGEATGYQLDIRGPTTSAVPGNVTALTEAFDSVTGNGGTAVDSQQFPGWTLENVFAATNELRVGSSKQGLVMTPAMDLGTTVTVSFAATRYGTDTPTVVVGLTNAGGAYVEQTVDVPAGGTNCTLVFTVGANGSRVIWKGNGASNQRFYLDNIEVSYWGVTAGGTPVSLTGYPTNLGPVTSVGVSNLIPSTEYEIYVAATDATRTSTWTSATVTTLDVVKSDQAIAFSMMAQQITTNLVTLVATADSGLPVSFTVASGPGAIAGGNTLTFTGAGEVSIVASQAGNTEFNPAPDVTNVCIVSKAWAVITLSNLEHEYSGSNCTATATTVPAGLTVLFTYDGSATPPITAGSYAVTGTVNDALYQGVASGTLVIAGEALTDFQLWLRDHQGQSLSDSNFFETADSDNDGMTTWEEYLADTDPNSANSVLALSGQYFIVSASNASGKIRMSFPASTSRYYQLVYSTNLTSPPLTNYLGQGVAGMAIITNVPGTWYGTIRVLLDEP